MDLILAAATLGVRADAPWAEVRRAHRAAIQGAHPDRPGGDTMRAAQLNQALEIFRQRTPAAPPPAQVVHLPAHAGILAQLTAAGHEIGHVVFADPHEGLLEVIVGEGANTSQLAVSVGEPRGDETPITFTLDALGPAPSPSIHDVVADLLRVAGV